MTTPQITDRRQKDQENFHNSIEIDGIREEVSAGRLLMNQLGRDSGRTRTDGRTGAGGLAV